MNYKKRYAEILAESEGDGDYITIVCLHYCCIYLATIIKRRTKSENISNRRAPR